MYRLIKYSIISAILTMVSSVNFRYVANQKTRAVDEFVCNTTTLWENQFEKDEFTIVSCAKTDITDIHIDAFVVLDTHYAKRVRTVDLSRNKISSLSAGTWDFLPNLSQLDMSHNDLLEIEEHTFHQNFGLQKLDFSNNDLRVISCTFEHLKSLRYLDLSSNRLPVFSETVFSPLLELGSPMRHLDISNNHFDCDCDILWLKGGQYNPQVTVKETITGKTSGKPPAVKCQLPALAQADNSQFSINDLLKNRNHQLFNIIKKNMCGSSEKMTWITEAILEARDQKVYQERSAQIQIGGIVLVTVLTVAVLFASMKLSKKAKNSDDKVKNNMSRFQSSYADSKNMASINE